MSEFEYDFDEPDMSSANTLSRNKGKVKPTKDGESAGYLIFGLGPGDDIVQLVDMETYDAFKLQGCAEGMIVALQAKYPDRQIEDGGNENTADGEAFLAKMRAKNKVLPARMARTGKEHDIELWDDFLDQFSERERKAVSRYAKWDGVNEHWVDGRPLA